MVTTLQVSNELRDEIAWIAEQRGVSMVEVVADAVRRFARDEWWSSVRSALDDLSPPEVDAYRLESQRLDATALDGLGDY